MIFKVRILNKCAWYLFKITIQYSAFQIFYDQRSFHVSLSTFCGKRLVGGWGLVGGGGTELFCWGWGGVITTLCGSDWLTEVAWG